ncbi:MAG: ribbon-helix-helix domain-containing protein [Desulfovibrionales bacterium]
MRRINLYLPDELIEELTRTAESRGETFSSLTRDVLTEYISNEKESGLIEKSGHNPRLPFLQADRGDDCHRNPAGEAIRESLNLHQDELAEIKNRLDLVLYYVRKNSKP